MVRRSSFNFSTRFYIIIGILAFAIIMGTIVGSSYKSTEGFVDGKNKTLIYLYMQTCGFCKEFNSTWDEISKNHAQHFKTVKYDMSSEEGNKLAKEFNINYAPALLLQVNNTKTLVYDKNTRNMNEILSWVNNN